MVFFFLDFTEKLMKFSIKHDYTNFTWELGNEPNDLERQLNFTLEPQQENIKFTLKSVFREFDVAKA